MKLLRDILAILAAIGYEAILLIAFATVALTAVASAIAIWRLFQ